MLRLDLIIDDFMDLRAYVSHTLLLHRLTLGMSTPESARLRLSDAAIWPFVSREITRFCDLASTLYGLESKAIDALLDDISKKNTLLESLRDDLVENSNDAALESFKALAGGEMHELFVRVRSVWNNEVPGFSEVASRSSIQDHQPEFWMEAFKKGIQTEIASAVESLVRTQDEKQAAEAYRLYWSIIEDVYERSRKAVVSAALFGGLKIHVPIIRSLQRLLRTSEGFVSCWSSSVGPDARGQVVCDQLQTMGLTSGEQLVERFRKIKLLDSR